MNNLLKIGSTVATFALFASSVVPAFATTNITNHGNGAFSYTSVGVSNTSNTEVVQTNSTEVVNSVNTESNTGKNSASYNTGGSSVVNSGGANTNTNVVTNSGDNVAYIAPAHTNGSTNITNKDNGAFSATSIGVNNTANMLVEQATECSVGNFIGTKSSTGQNSSSFNTHGWNAVNSGQVNTNTNVMTNCGSNGVSNSGVNY